MVDSIRVIASKSQIFLTDFSPDFNIVCIIKSDGTVSANSRYLNFENIKMSGWDYYKVSGRNKWIGFLLIIGSIGVFVPYAVLAMSFEYPDILRQNAGVVLTKFHEGGASLILTWWAFAILGIPLLVAYVLIGKQWKHLPFMSWVTTFGVISGVAQILGLLRWVFVIPVIAQDYVMGNEVVKQSTVTSFKVVHQLGGVLLGEHIGQLFTIVWSVMVCVAILKSKLIATV